jgi:lipoate-protein ligase A
VTLGRFQDATSVDLDLCGATGVDVVRRHTGGRGVLHADEITYSVVAGTTDGVPRGVTASYRHLCAALVAAYHELGIDATLTLRDRGAVSTAACYLQTTRADVSVGKRKLSGSAQVWAGETVLQHGSFVLHRDPDLESRLFRLHQSDASKLIEATRALDELVDQPPSQEDIVAAIVSGFSDALGVTLVAGALTAREAELAAEIMDSAPAVSSQWQEHFKL